MRLFLAFSPLQVLLSYALAAQGQKGAGDLLILGSGSSRIKAVVEVLSEVFPKVAFRVCPLETTEKQSNLRGLMIKKRNLKKLQETVEALQESIEDFYYSAEWNVYTTWLSHLFKMKKAPPRFHLLDDGIGVYSSPQLRTKRPLEKVLDRLIYGPWHKNCAKVGTLNEGALLELLFPELLASFYPGSFLRKIDPQPLKAALDFSALPESTAAQLEGLEPEVLIALDSLNFHPLPAYGAAVRSRIDRALKRGQRVALKLHPSDVGAPGALEQIDPTGQAAVLPAFLPIEIYYLYFQRSLKEVLGGLSSSLMTARWLLPSVAVTVLCGQEEYETNPEMAGRCQVFQELAVAMKFF